MSLAFHVVVHLLLMVQIHAVIVFGIICLALRTILTSHWFALTSPFLIWILTVDVMGFNFKIFLFFLDLVTVMSWRVWMVRCSSKNATWISCDSVTKLIIKWVYCSVPRIKIVCVHMWKPSTFDLSTTLLPVIVSNSWAFGAWKIEHLVAEGRNIFSGMALVKVDAKIIFVLLNLAHSTLGCFDVCAQLWRFSLKSKCIFEGRDLFIVTIWCWTSATSLAAHVVAMISHHHMFLGVICFLHLNWSVSVLLFIIAHLVSRRLLKIFIAIWSKGQLGVLFSL